jgi:hypothetical protein
MAFWATIAVYGAVFVLSKILAKNAQNRLGEFGKPPDITPTTAEGTPIPIFYGRVRIEAPNLVWSGFPKFVDGAWQTNAMFVLGTAGQGYHYAGDPGHAGVLLENVVVNGAVQERISQLYYDTDGQIEGLILNVPHGYGPFRCTDGDDTFFFTEPNVCYRLTTYNPTSVVYRGDSGSRLVASAFLEQGLDNVGDNSRIGANLFQHETPSSADRYTLWPAYRSQTKVLMTGPLGRDYTQAQLSMSDIGRAWRYSTDSADLPGVAFDVISSITVAFDGEPVISGTSDGDANPVAVLFDILTNKWSRVGLDVSKIDQASFAAAGVTLKSERNGISMVLTERSDAKDIIKEILAQIDGVLYEDPETRKLVLKLIRADYVVGGLPTFSPNNVVHVESFKTSTFDQTYNEVRVLYRDRSENWTERTAVAQDMANLTSQGGRVRALTIQHRGVANAILAATIAARELNELSLPLAQLSIRVNRDAWTQRPASCFKFSWPEYGMEEVVFRTQALDFGTLDDGTIMVHAVQDRFAVLGGLIGEPEIMPQAVAPPRAIERRIFTEAPRWFLRKAVARGINTDIDIPRGYYLGARPEEASTGHLMRITDNADEEDRTFLKTDRWQVNYARIHGVVETAYSRTAEPYDTATGLRITLDPFSSLPNFGATAAEIAKGKRSIVYVGGEIMAFETLTFISGFTWRLDDVWRGLLDTVPQEHAVGEPVFILSFGNEFTGDFFTGNVHNFTDDPVIKAAMLPLTNGAWMQFTDDAVELDTITTRGRTLLPYPGANVEIDGTKGTTRREEEGFELSWLRRHLNYTDIVRGDDPSQIVTGTQYHLYAKKVGPQELVGAEKLIGIATSVQEALEVAASEAGHGTLAVFPRTVDLVDGYTNWQDPELHVEFPCWRNLIANCRFVDDFSLNVTQPWTIVAGSPLRHSDADSLGGSGTSWYVAVDTGGAESATLEIYQDVFVSEWHPSVRMGALLTFYRKRLGDVDDTLQVSLIAYDISGTQLDIDTSGPINPPTTWTRTELAIANMDPATYKLRVRILMTAVDEPPIFPNAAVAEVALHVGQLGIGFLSNIDFATDLSSWTVASGTFTRQTANSYTGVGYARGGTGTTNELYQDMSFPAVLSFGTAVVEYAQGDEGGADNDLGYLQIDARNSGGTVIASASVPAVKAVTTTGTWARRRVVLENIPPATTVLRVRLIATRTAAGTADATFDDINLKLFKELNPDYKLDLSVTTPPTTRFPKSGSAWYDAYPSVPPPDFMLYDGEKLEGQVGIESNLGTPATPYLGKLHGPYDVDHDTWSSSVYDFRPGCEALEAIDDGAGYFANFASGEAFTVVAIVRPGHGNTTTRRICGRIDGTTGGWCLEHLATNRFQARIRSGGSQWVASPTLVTLPGGLYCVQMTYDPAAGQLRCSVNHGTQVTTAVPVGTSIKASNELIFRIGKAESTDTIFCGQIARLYGWRTAHANFMADMDTFGSVPAGITQPLVCSQAGQLMTRLGNDDDGAVFAVYAPGHIPLGRAQGAWGYVMADQVANICPSRDLTNATAYPAVGTGVTVTRVGVVGPTGEGNGIRVETTTTDSGFQVIDIPVSSATTVHVYWFARAIEAPGGNVTLRLENTSGVAKGTHTFSVTGQWVLFEHAFTTWDDSTANCQLEFVKHATGTETFDIAGPIVVNQDLQVQYALPYDDLIDQHSIEVDLTGITEQFNHEGEVYIEGTKTSSTAGPSPDGLAIDVSNTANNNDRRLYTISDASGSLSHYNATGTVATGTSGTPTWTGNTAWSARARWNRLGLHDSLTSWARSVTNGTASSARAATFTASTTPMVELSMTGGVSGIVRRLILFAREVILGQDV